MTSEEKVTTADDGVDLGEILVALWVGKFRIAIVVVFFVVFALAYAISSSPQFRAKSVFEVKSAVGSGNLSAQLGGLASLAGIDFGSSSEGTVLVRLAGRDFMDPGPDAPRTAHPLLWLQLRIPKRHAALRGAGGGGAESLRGPRRGAGSAFGVRARQRLGLRHRH